jgi:hypothetical protein
MTVDFYQISGICKKSLQIAICKLELANCNLQAAYEGIRGKHTVTKVLQAQACKTQFASSSLQIGFANCKAIFKRFLLHKSLEPILAPKRGQAASENDVSSDVVRRRPRQPHHN